jgi:RNA polymerase sigma-70 factor (ECF subfamily)
MSALDSQLQEPDTEELVRRAGQGEEPAMRALLERHRARLARMVQVRMDPRVRARLDPSDVVQETLVAASKKMENYLARRPLPFYPWLRQIAWEKLVHLHDRHLRAAKRSVAREQFFRPGISDESALELAGRFVGAASSPSAAALRNELRDRVRRALDCLTADDRELLLLRYLEQMPSKEIAAILGASEAAINMRHMRALERMRRVLVRNPGEI